MRKMKTTKVQFLVAFSYIAVLERIWLFGS